VGLRGDFAANPGSVHFYTFAIKAFGASDNIAVSGYLVTELVGALAVTTGGWSATAPSSYIVATSGAKTLYAWAKDAAGHVSLAKIAKVTVP
jgi:hypothetical protein